MADQATAAAQQREARRQKLIQNAEARMNRVLGRKTESAQDEDDKENSLLTSMPPFSPSSPDEQQRAAPATPEGHSSPYNLRQRPQRGTPSVTSSPARTPRTPKQPSPVINSTDENPPTTTPPSQSQESAQKNTNGTGDVLEDKPPAGPLEGFDARSLEILKICSCIITAFLARYTLKFGVGLFIFQSIFLPFIAMELALTYFIQTYMQGINLPHSQGNMMTAALKLCGIKQEVLDTYQQIMSCVTWVTSDFCLYLFAFIVWNTAIA